MTATALINDPVLDPPPGSPDSPVSPLVLVGGPGDSGDSGDRGPGAAPHGELAPVIRLERRHVVEVYRRRRFVAALIATVLIVAATQLAGISMLSFGSLTDPATVASVDAEVAPVVHVVRPGDTYAAIAASFDVAQPAAFADELRAANGGAELAVGQRLLVSAEIVQAAR